MTNDTWTRPRRVVHLTSDPDLTYTCRSCALWDREELDDTHGRCLNIANVARSEKFVYITGPNTSCSGYQRG